MSRRWVGHRVALLLLVVTGTLPAACTDSIVLGSVPPATFQFTNVVPLRGSRPGGWKVAQVVILLGRLSPRYSETAFCDIEVGVPEVTELKPIETPAAQQAAALAADEAARHILKRRLPTAVACDEFRTKMESIMKDPKQGDIPGTRVTPFLSQGVPQRTFP
ncbi:MAG TPA: hypothetical protein VNA24_07205 [Hyalangium sp.]|nr:hypothetical protein [Hyalangium sp.]